METIEVFAPGWTSPRVLAQRLLIGVLALLAVFLALPSVAMAAGVGLDSDTAPILIVSPEWQLVISALIPIIVGIATKASLPTFWKGLLTLTLNAVAALVLTATMTDAALITSESLLQWGVGFAISVALYAGVYDTSLRLTSKANGRLAPNAGLGPVPPVP